VFPIRAQVHRACRSVQQRILYADRRCDGPTLDGKTGMPLTPRQHAERMGIKQPNGDGVGVIIVGAQGSDR